MTLMPFKTFGLAALLFVSFSSTACGDTNLRKINEAAKVFHLRFNAAQFSEIYRDAHPQFRASVTEADFIARLAGLRRKHGAILNSNVNGVEDKSGFRRYFPKFQKTRVSSFYNHCESEGFQELFMWDVSGTEVRLKSYVTDIAFRN
jgi:hypothetical protein